MPTWKPGSEKGAGLAAFLFGIAPILSFGCDVEVADNTGGTEVQSGLCGRGVIVVNTDYQSTNLSLVSVQGEVLSPSFFSSASSATGLSAPLSGDVVLPTQTQSGDAIVLLDRYPASVLTWVDIATGVAEGQLSVATGFPANPRDYLEISKTKAYVTRYDPNPLPGKQSWDEGSDIVMVNPQTRTLIGRMDMSPTLQGEPEGYHPRPDKLLGVDGKGIVLLGSYSTDFLVSLASRVAVIDSQTDELEDTTILQGMHGCMAMALSPSKSRVAVACSGEFAGDSVTTLSESGIVILSLGEGLEETRRFPAAKFGNGPVGGTIAYASETRILFTTFGQFADGNSPQRQDALFQVDVETGEFDLLLTSESQPFSLGDIRCAVDCGVCYVADAERSGGILHRLLVESSGITVQSETVVDRSIGLPPRNLGWF